MNNGGRIFVWAVVVILLAACAAGLYFGVGAVFSHIVGWTPTAGMMTFAAVTVALIGARMIASGPVRAANRQAEFHSRQQRIATYRAILTVWQARLPPEAIQPGTVSPNSDDELENAERDLLFFGSPKIITKYLQFKDAAVRKQPDARGAFKQLLVEIRKDVGQHNLGITDEQLLQLLGL